MFKIHQNRQNLCFFIHVTFVYPGSPTETWCLIYKRHRVSFFLQRAWLHKHYLCEYDEEKAIHPIFLAWISFSLYLEL